MSTTPTEPPAGTQERARFSVTFPVRYQDSDRHLRAAPAAILGAMQETAILHAEAVGRGVEWLTSRGRGWLLVQNRAQIVSAPRWREALRVTTWSWGMTRLLSRREFLLEGPNGGLRVRASTLWAFVEGPERRVSRVAPEVAKAYAVDPTPALPGSFRRPARCPPPGASEVRSVTLPVLRRDIDSNGHVNNLRYLEWMLEALPPGASGWTAVEWNVRYQRETPPGGAMISTAVELPPGDDGLRRFAHRIDPEGGGETAATGETTWHTEIDPE